MHFASPQKRKLNIASDKKKLFNEHNDLRIAIVVNLDLDIHSKN